MHSLKHKFINTVRHCNMFHPFRAIFREYN